MRLFFKRTHIPFQTPPLSVETSAKLTNNTTTRYFTSISEILCTLYFVSETHIFSTGTRFKFFFYKEIVSPEEWVRVVS